MRWLSIVLLAACAARARAPEVPHLVATSDARWYRVEARCSQGPFELEVPSAGAPYGERAELNVHTDHAVALEAVVLVEGREVERTHGVFVGTGPSAGPAANLGCVADARERRVLAAPAALDPAGPGPRPPTGARVPDARSPTTPVALVAIPDLVPSAATVMAFPMPAGHATIRFWSIEPNDLVDVAFGVTHIVMRPSVSPADYEAHLARERLRVSTPVERPRVDAAADRERAERARHAAEDRARREAVEAALAAERAGRRARSCAAHHDDRDCWGPGGFAGQHELDLATGERDRYCGAQPDDARCWSDSQWRAHREAWAARTALARTPPPRPTTPPPAPLADPEPPPPSTHATWRPGYFEWTGGQWVWLGGMWRVPDADIVAEQTATAPVPPPPPRFEVPPSPPVRTVVWVPGAWMWNGAGWLWFPGTYQLRPEPSLDWRAPTWRARGTVQVLVPGGWVRR